jgi:hypothetical protein
MCTLAFQIQEPGFQLDTTRSTISMQASVSAKDAMAGDNYRDGIGGFHATNRPGSIGISCKGGDLLIRGCLTVGDFCREVQYLLLEWGERINPDQVELLAVASEDYQAGSMALQGGSRSQQMETFDKPSIKTSREMLQSTAITPENEAATQRAPIGVEGSRPIRRGIIEWLPTGL